MKSTVVGVISVVMGSVSGALGIVALHMSFYSGAIAFLGLAVLAIGWACFAREDFYA